MCYKLRDTIWTGLPFVRSVVNKGVSKMRVVLVTVLGTAVPNHYERHVLLPYAQKHFVGWLDDNKYDDILEVVS
jgi:hypothetical protein